MNLLHLKYAVEVEKTGSITQAAENLFMGQPNLSRAIKDLEASVGLIFKRTSKGVVPTPRGEEFLRYAKSILAQIDEMEARYRTNSEDRINFNVCIPRASYLARAFTDFVNALPSDKGMEINYRETNSVEAITSIAQGEYNLGIVRYQSVYEKYFRNLVEEKDLHYEEIWSFDYVVLFSAEHPLAQQKELSCDALLHYIEVVHGDLSVPYLSFADAKTMMNEEVPHKRIYIYERGSQFCLLSRVPTTYMWVSPVPADLLARYGLVQRPCCAEHRAHKDVVVYPKNHRLDAYEQAFLKQVTAARDELQGKNT